MSGVKTMAIKARLSNLLRKTFYKRTETDFTAEEKLTLFDAILSETQEMHFELNMYKSKRKSKRFVEQQRALRGFKPKNKTTLEQWKLKQQSNITA